MNHTIRGALLLAVALFIGGNANAQFDCDEIDIAAQETFERSRAAQRQEITRPSSNGGAFGKPVQSRIGSCANDVLKAMEGVSLVMNGQCGGSAASGIIRDFFGDGAGDIFDAIDSFSGGWFSAGAASLGIVSNTRIADCVSDQASKACDRIDAIFTAELGRLRTGIPPPPAEEQN